MLKGGAPCRLETIGAGEMRRDRGCKLLRKATVASRNLLRRDIKTFGLHELDQDIVCSVFLPGQFRMFVDIKTELSEFLAQLLNARFDADLQSEISLIARSELRIGCKMTNLAIPLSPDAFKLVLYAGSFSSSRLSEVL